MVNTFIAQYLRFYFTFTYQIQDHKFKVPFENPLIDIFDKKLHFVEEIIHIHEKIIITVWFCRYDIDSIIIALNPQQNVNNCIFMVSVNLKTLRL